MLAKFTAMTFLQVLLVAEPAGESFCYSITGGTAAPATCSVCNAHHCFHHCTHAEFVLTAWLQINLKDCFKGASLVDGAAVGIPLGPKASVTCKFSAQNAVISGTDPAAVSVSIEQLVIAKDAASLKKGNAGACHILATKAGH